ncbi:unnamed protein product [Didymodactylos carnosus]|uniref:NUCB1-like N-terminal domain-containing protein n=1 Tax=Didymodactylos carnosus TaxID=1234261 RepID=A0A815HI98_9BILA|nr:unnamed protein product [Didymodactylos carnosus]CAF4224485.1 unnamed protein product [Didymodactylos carnosus]
MIGMKFILLCHLSIIISVYAPPVLDGPSKKRLDDYPVNNDKPSKDVLDDLEYARYLKEVVEILENDPNFKSIIEKASPDDIKSGNIARHLSLVEHNVRTALDEAKQRELARLRKLVSEKVRLLNDIHRQGGLRGMSAIVTLWRILSYVEVCYNVLLIIDVSEHNYGIMC